MGREVEGESVLGMSGCPVIHTFFVRAPLDVVFCDPAGRVLRVVPKQDPGTVGPWVRGAALAWEGRAGLLAPFVRVGDIVCLGTA